MLDKKKLDRLGELLELKKRTDTELAQLLGEEDKPDKPRRGRPRATIDEVEKPQPTGDSDG